MNAIRKGSVILTGAAVVVLTGGMAVAQKSIESTNVSGQPSQTQQPQTQQPHMRFVKEAAEGGMLEVQLGQLAQQKASSPEVKQFAQRMVTDHTKLNSELTTITSQQNLPTPTQLMGKDKAQYDRLAALTGPQFDRAYMRDQVRDHEKDIAEFQKEANNGTDPAVKNFAANALPILHEHLMLAQSTENSLNASSHR